MANVTSHNTPVEERHGAFLIDRKNNVWAKIGGGALRWFKTWKYAPYLFRDLKHLFTNRPPSYGRGGGDFATVDFECCQIIDDRHSKADLMIYSAAQGALSTCVLPY
jgi:hypothetical protein